MTFECIFGHYANKRFVERISQFHAEYRYGHILDQISYYLLMTQDMNGRTHCICLQVTPTYSVRSDPVMTFSSGLSSAFIRENVRINMRAMSIPVLGVKLWNSLNESLVSIMSKHKFRHHYINILIGKYTT